MRMERLVGLASTPIRLALGGRLPIQVSQSETKARHYFVLDNRK